MKILKNFILGEWLSLFFLSTVIISFILVIGNIIKLVELIITKGINFTIVAQLFLFLMPSLLIFSIPIAILTATLLTFGRMSYENEITAIRSSGINLYPFLGTILLIGTLFSALCLHFNDSIIPYAHYQIRVITQEIGIKKPTTYLEEKTFIKAFKDHIMFIYKIRGNYLEDVRIYQPQTNKPTRSIMARTGQFISIPEKNSIKLILNDGTADEPSFEDPEMFYKLNFKRYQLSLKLAEDQISSRLKKKVSDMTIDELQREINLMRSLNIDATPLFVGLHRKFAISFSSMIFILIGIPLAIRIKRRERSMGFAISVIICLCYYLLMATGESLALRNKLPAFFGVWFANIVFLFLGVILNIKMLEK
ncbi:MAG: LptF/LptG family permease [Candidatus Omnitrophota bacterium]